MPCVINWTCTLQCKKISPRSDVYYYSEEFNKKLKSNREVKEFCAKNNIFFDPDLFNFSTWNKYQGPIPIPDSTEPFDKNDNKKVDPSNMNIENNNNPNQTQLNQNTEL